MPVEFVSPAGTVYTRDVGGGTSFTLNKPSNAAQGHLLVAVVAWWASAQRTVSVSGWTVRQTTFRSSGGDNFQVALLTRQAGASEPSSWSGSLSGTGYLMAAGVVAYSGVQTVGSSAKATAGSGSSFSTGSVSSAVDGAVRVVAGAYFDANADSTISCNGSTRELLATAEDTSNGGATQAALWDTSLATARTISRGSSWDLAGSVIIALEPSLGTPASGSAGVSLPRLVAAADGEVHNDVDIDVSLPALGFEGEGYGQPPDVDIAGAMVLPLLSVDVQGGVPATGEMSVELSVFVEFVAETRKFGERVFAVEAEPSRRIIVPSRGVDG